MRRAPYLAALIDMPRPRALEERRRRLVRLQRVRELLAHPLDLPRRQTTDVRGDNFIDLRKKPRVRVQ